MFPVQPPPPPKPTPLWAKIITVSAVTIILVMTFGIILGFLTNLLIKAWT